MATDIQMSQNRKLPVIFGVFLKTTNEMVKSKTKRRMNQKTHRQKPFPIFSSPSKGNEPFLDRPRAVRF
jgi:hypothetical protein